MILKSSILHFALLLAAVVAICGCGGGGLSVNPYPEIIIPTSIPEGQTIDKQKCNGASLLCDRKYNEVVYPTTHNSMSNLEEGWTAPNQWRPIATQLEDGIRGLSLDLYYYDDEVYLCHGYCWAGKALLTDKLAEIKTFMDENPNEVITFILESYVSGEDFKKAMEDTGMLAFAYEYDETEGWPTLREMISANKRLVVFTDKDGGDYPWFLNEWKHTFSTPYSFSTSDDFNCRAHRGTAGNPVFQVPHFLTRSLPSTNFAQEVNVNPLFINRMKECMEAQGQLPNIIMVDHYHIGNLFDVCDELNGVTINRD